MPQKLKFIYFISILLFMPVLGRGQSSEAMANFSVTEIGDGFVISWTIKAGYSCFDVGVEHSADGVNFARIYTYPTVCGAAANDETYNYIHQNPVTGKNYYRMDLSNYGISETLSINFIDISEKGFVIYPMPITEHSKILLSQAFLNFSFSIFNHSGKMIHQIENFKEREYAIGKLNLNSGTYYFQISNGIINHSGSFIKP
jgi:hypothetical protein